MPEITTLTSDKYERGVIGPHTQDSVNHWETYSYVNTYENPAIFMTIQTF